MFGRLEFNLSNSNYNNLRLFIIFLIICASQESLDLVTPQSQDASRLLPPPHSSTLLSSSAEEHPQTESEKMDAHLLKKMAFR